MILIALTLLLGGSFTQHTFTSAAGSRDYWLYVPASYDGSKPVALVVMLHGCTQDAKDSARGTRWNEHAEKGGFIVVYPEQPASANPLKCWNWFDAQHQERDAGEPALIAGITQQVVTDYAIDRGRVFLAGISAGAAMANIVAVNHPELYRAVALHSGIEYKAATSVLDARKAMNEGGPDPEQQGRAAHAAMGRHARPIPVLVVQGGRDASVPALHAEQIARQWLATNALLGRSAAAETTDAKNADGYRLSRTIHRDSQTRRTIVESIVIDELGHAWSGGAAAGTFTDPKGPDATAEMLRFFTEAARP